MSLLINMKMLKDKPVAVVIHPDGTAYTAEMFAGVCTKYLADYTAVPVPPHGRLIDADALAEYIYQQCDWLSETAIHVFCGILDKAPTILESTKR